MYCFFVKGLYNRHTEIKEEQRMLVPGMALVAFVFASSLVIWLQKQKRKAKIENRSLLEERIENIRATD